MPLDRHCRKCGKLITKYITIIPLSGYASCGVIQRRQCYEATEGALAMHEYRAAQRAVVERIVALRTASTFGTASGPQRIGRKVARLVIDVHRYPASAIETADEDVAHAVRAAVMCDLIGTSVAGSFAMCSTPEKPDASYISCGSRGGPSPSVFA